jgi:hypothetical protein
MFKESHNLGDAVIQQRIENPDAFVQQDAQQLAFVMVRNGIDDPDDAIDTVLSEEEFWDSLRKYPKYMHRVKHIARDFAKKLRVVKKHPELLPPPAPPGQGGGGGGAPPAMAAVQGKVVTAQEDFGSPQASIRIDSVAGGALAKTWGAGFLDGSLTVLTPEGEEITIRTARSRAPRNSPIIVAIYEMEMQLNKAIIAAVTEVLAKYEKKMSPASIQAWLDMIKTKRPRHEDVGNVARFFQWNMAPFNALFTDPVYAMMLLDEHNHLVSEPEATMEVRKAIGKAMEPFVQKLAQAVNASFLGISPTLVIPPQNSPLFKKYKQKNEKKISEPRVLLPEETERSEGDFSSWLMTAVSEDALPVARQHCVRLLMENIYENYEEYIGRPISPGEYDRMRVGAEGDDTWEQSLNDLADVINGVYMDDRKLLEAITKGNNGSDQSLDNSKFHLVALAAAQNRQWIIRNAPQICFGVVNEDDYTSFPVVVQDFFDKLDPTDPKALAVIKDVVDHGDDVSNADPSYKVDEAIYKTGDNDLISKVLEKTNGQSVGSPLRKSTEVATLYAISKVRTPEDATAFLQDTIRQEAIQNVTRNIGNSRGDNPEGGLIGGLFLSALGKSSLPLETVRQFLGNSGMKPINALIFGDKEAQDIRRKARINWNGEPLPTASEIKAKPEDPLDMAKLFADIQDYSALFALLTVCANDIVAHHNRQINQWDEYTIKYILEVLQASPLAESAQRLMSSIGMFWNNEGALRAIRRSLSPSQVSIMHIQDAGDGGDPLTAARYLAQIYSVQPDVAVSIFHKLRPFQNFDQFKSMLPVAMQRALQPKQPDVEATVLPNGLVLTKTGGVYTVKTKKASYSFVASDAEAPRIAMLKALNEGI